MPRYREGGRQRNAHRRNRHDARASVHARTRDEHGRGDGAQRPTSGENIGAAAARAARSRPVRRLLEGIGAPAPAPFKPDPFQLEALAAVEHEDVLVTAPTGSGKTWIAREEIRRLLAAHRRVWYTSPLQALTNSKYQEFVEEVGQAAVGILPGDRKELADETFIVGITEIFRNQLFDSLRG